MPGRKKERKEEPVIEEVIREPEAAVLAKDVEAWALENGLRAPLRFDGPSKEYFRVHGQGYVVNVRELEGKHRMATAKYTAEGRRSFWQQDGMVTG